jgi:hypothetical protein
VRHRNKALCGALCLVHHGNKAFCGALCLVCHRNKAFCGALDLVRHKISVPDIQISAPHPTYHTS